MEPEWDDVGSFVARHGDGILRFAFLLTGGRAAEAEDIVQNVLMRLTERGLHGIEEPWAYCRRAVVNEHSSMARRALVAFHALPRLVSAPDTEPTNAVDDRRAMLIALSRLRPRERDAIVMRYYEDLDDQTIAAEIGCKQSTVRSLIHRALPKLKDALDSDDTNPTPAEDSQ